MKAMMELKEMLCKELEAIAKKGELNAGGLETVHKLTDTIKNIDKIMVLEEADGEYSERRGYSRDGGMYSERRDSRGRYSRDDGMYSQAYDEAGSSYARRGRYSRDDGKEHMMRTFGEMMEGADERQRHIIQRAMDELRSA